MKKLFGAVSTIIKMANPIKAIISKLLFSVITDSVDGSSLENVIIEI